MHVFIVYGLYVKKTRGKKKKHLSIAEYPMYFPFERYIIGNSNGILYFYYNIGKRVNAIYYTVRPSVQIKTVF